MSSVARVSPSKRGPNRAGWTSRTREAGDVLFHRKRDAETHRRKVEAAADEEAVSSKDPFDQAFAKFMRQLKGTVCDNTGRFYGVYGDKLVSALGKKPVYQITPQAFAQVRPGLGNKRTQLECEWLINRFWGFCVRRGALPKHPNLNPLPKPLPSQVVQRHSKPRKIKAIPSLEQYLYLLDRAAPGRVDDFVRLGLQGGLRPGESGALLWSDYNPSTALFSINKTIQNTGRVKTEPSNRFVKVVGDLKLYLDREIQRRKPPPNSPIFAKSDGSYYGPLALRWALYDWQVSIGIGRKVRYGVYRGVFGPHQLRHAAVAMMIWLKVSPEDLAAWLGHADTDLIYDTYGYLLKAYAGGAPTWPKEGPIDEDEGEEDEP